MSRYRYRGPMLVTRRVTQRLTDDGMAVMDQLAQARRAAGLTQVQVAKIMDCAPSSIADMECGRHLYGPNLTKLIRYARAVGVSAISIPETAADSLRTATDNQAVTRVVEP